MSKFSSNKRKLKEKRAIVATIGFCFVTVLVVLFVLAIMLSNVYVTALETERSNKMKTLVVSSATVLSHCELSENMKYPLPVYTYDSNGESKSYIVDVYTKAGNSYLKLFTSDKNSDASTEHTLSGAGDVYNKCFDSQIATFTNRTEKGIKYACAIAPIISSNNNTVAGILELRMPWSDFTSTQNGLSLSWIFTLIAIAVSVAIIIFEINLLISTISLGDIGNVPPLLSLAEEKVRFLSFFVAFSSIIQPVVLMEYIKKNMDDYSSYVSQGTIVITFIIYCQAFFGMEQLKKSIKNKITSKISLIAISLISYVLSLISGIIGNFVVSMVLMFPVAFTAGMLWDYLRDYRINASKLKFEGFDDKTIHALQHSGTFLGVTVGAVIGGILYEQFGLVVVNLIGSTFLVFTALAMVYFIKNNNPVNEQKVSFGHRFELLGNHYIGSFLLSTYCLLGVGIAFLLLFLPNFLKSRGIALATLSFYYLVCAVSASFLTVLIKYLFAHILSSKIRVTLSSTSMILGFLLFALFPTAKMLVLTVTLIGISLGIHDYTYLSVLQQLASKGKIKTNLRRIAERTLLSGIILSLIVFSIAMAMDEITLVFLIFVAMILVFGFSYPMSKTSDIVDSVKRTRSVVQKKVKSSKIAKNIPEDKKINALDVNNDTQLFNYTPIGNIDNYSGNQNQSNNGTVMNYPNDVGLDSYQTNSYQSTQYQNNMNNDFQNNYNQNYNYSYSDNQGDTYQNFYQDDNNQQYYYQNDKNNNNNYMNTNDSFNNVSNNSYNPVNNSFIDDANSPYDPLGGNT